MKTFQLRFSPESTPGFFRGHAGRRTRGGAPGRRRRGCGATRLPPTSSWPEPDTSPRGRCSATSHPAPAGRAPRHRDAAEPPPPRSTSITARQDGETSPAARNDRNARSMPCSTGYAGQVTVAHAAQLPPRRAAPPAQDTERGGPLEATSAERDRAIRRHRPEGPPDAYRASLTSMAPPSWLRAWPGRAEPPAQERCSTDGGGRTRGNVGPGVDDFR
ncbi:hypothetical protein SAMN04489731_11213 [Amycolatopsis regifaucium]|nr:hypothetical protein SAMN04489731_11213 [Amycolatopsis regifaucium]